MKKTADNNNFKTCKYCQLTGHQQIRYKDCLKNPNRNLQNEIITTNNEVNQKQIFHYYSNICLNVILSNKPNNFINIESVENNNILCNINNSNEVKF